MYLFIRGVIKQIVVIIETYHFCQLLSRLTPLAEEIIGDHHGFRCNRSTSGHIFCIRHILEKIWEYSEAVHQLFVDFRTYDSVRKEVLYNLFEFGIT